MALDHPIKTSQVIVLNQSNQNPQLPPPSPPSPATPCERSLSPPLDEDEFLSISDPNCDPISTFDKRLTNAVHVLGTEATALSHLTRLYDTDPVAREGFNSVVDTIIRTRRLGGKVNVTGVGKSAAIGNKFVKTLKSLNIFAENLDAIEAKHGDLGGINAAADTTFLITYSGATQELLDLLCYLPPVRLIIMTKHTDPSTCEIIKRRPDTILLPAPIHISETESHGFNAPTTSTSVALALCDALAVVIANEIHDNVGEVFRRYHPGGAIGAASREPKRLMDLATPFLEIPQLSQNAATGAHVLVAAFKSKSRWLRQGDILIPPKRIEQIQPEYLDEPASCIQGLMVSRKRWIELPDTMDISQARDLILLRQRAGKSKYDNEGIIVILDDEEITGVMEIGDLMRS